jgi:hypothetical protein
MQAPARASSNFWPLTIASAVLLPLLLVLGLSFVRDRAEAAKEAEARAVFSDYYDDRMIGPEEVLLRMEGIQARCTTETMRALMAQGHEPTWIAFEAGMSSCLAKEDGSQDLFNFAGLSLSAAILAGAWAFRRISAARSISGGVITGSV